MMSMSSPWSGRWVLRGVILGLLLTSIAAAIAQAQTAPPSVDTSGWKTYRNPTMGFEVSHPDTWRATEARGTGPEMVLLGQPSTPGTPRRVLQFWVQRKMNPQGLTIEQWYAEQLSRLKVTTLPKTTATTIGGRAALRREMRVADGVNVDFFTTAGRTDIFQVTITPALPDATLDPIHARIIASLKLIE